MFQLSDKLRFVTRTWYYFRMGYGTYLTFLLGYVSTLITVYYLAIKSIPSLLDLFPRFVPFAMLATIIGVPLSVGIGWVHLKRSSAYTSEQDIATESNPYNYKLPPGFSREVSAPAWILLLQLAGRLADAQGLMNEGDRVQLREVTRKYNVLMTGGYVGAPRTKAFKPS